MRLDIHRTQRGFSRAEFSDRYNTPCAIQDSSIATEDCLWFGVVDPRPQVLASQAHAVGLTTTQTTGWIPYPIPEQVLLHTQMHLTVDMAKALLPLLERFINHGTIEVVAEGEDPTYPMADWRHLVANDETSLGYTEWVQNQRDMEDDT